MALWDLKTLKDLGAFVPTMPGQLSKFLDIEVPQGQFLAITPSPLFLRIGGYVVLPVTGPATGTSQDVVLPLPIAQPPSDYAVDNDQIVKAYADTDGDGVFETKLTVTNINYATKTVTVTLPSGWDNTVTHNVRFGFLLGDGYFYFTRELPDNATNQIPKKIRDWNCLYVNTLDQLETPLDWGSLPWLVEKCHLRGYIYIPKGPNGESIYFDDDLTMGVTQIMISYQMTDMDSVQALYAQHIAAYPGLAQLYPDLYKLLVAQLAGIVPDTVVPKTS